MKYLFDAMCDRLGEQRNARKAPSAGRSFTCRCGRPVFFPNSQCLGCGTALGYDPGLGRIVPLLPQDAPAQAEAPAPVAATEPPPSASDVAAQNEQAPQPAPGAADDAGTPPPPPIPLWHAATPQPGEPMLYRRCDNFQNSAACNWVLPLTGPDDAHATAPTGLCRACALNRTIPDLTIPENQVWWGRIELAKRRLVSSLIALGLPVQSRVTEDLQGGLAFDLLRPSDALPVVHTGHDNGVITLNIEEADDARREGVRAAMHEPYRTLLGHIRHEVGHYYWQRLVENTDWHTPFRELFGDEQQDYGAALQRHYEQGPPPGWQLQHVSAYASAHPWEDWAETWAHYLHMVDTLDTALSFGLDGENVEIKIEKFTNDALYRASGDADGEFLSFVNAWVELTAVLNELSRSMGFPPFYPFALPPAAVRKLHFIHLVVEQASANAGVTSAAPPAAPAPANPAPPGVEPAAVPAAVPAGVATGAPVTAPA